MLVFFQNVLFFLEHGQAIWSIYILSWQNWWKLKWYSDKSKKIPFDPILFSSIFDVCFNISNSVSEKCENMNSALQCGGTRCTGHNPCLWSTLCSTRRNVPITAFTGQVLISHLRFQSNEGALWIQDWGILSEDLLLSYLYSITSQYERQWLVFD